MIPKPRTIKIIGPFLYESLRGEMEEMENKNEIELEVNKTIFRYIWHGFRKYHKLKQQRYVV